MNADLIDRLARSVARPRSRRALLRGVAVAAATAAVGLAHAPAAAAGCAKAGKSCKQAEQCCSGICTGQHGKKKCRAHGSGTCKRSQDICTVPAPDLARCNNNANCQCFPTTAGAIFCAGVGSACAVCERDADCIALGFPPGSACGEASTGRCAGVCESSTICVVPCSAAP